MKQNKLAILILGIIVVLFILALMSGAFLHKDDQGTKPSMSKVNELRKSWIGKLDNTMAPFRSSLDIHRIKNRPACQMSEGVYKLTGSQDSCTIIIGAKDGSEIEEAVLSVKEANVKFLVPQYPDDESTGEVTRGSRILTGKVNHFKTITEAGRIRPEIIRPDVSAQPIRLSVVYEPADGSDGGNGGKTKWVETEEVKLIVLNMGGTLKLKCENCTTNQTITVSLK